MSAFCAVSGTSRLLLKIVTSRPSSTKPMGNIVRVIRNGDRRGRQCVPFVRRVTGTKCFYVVRSLHKRNDDMQGPRSLNRVCNINLRKFLSSVRRVAHVTGGE